LNLSTQVQLVAEDIAIHAKTIHELSGKSPITIASASIFMAIQVFDCNVSTNDIALVSGISNTTIKGAYKIMYGEHPHFMYEICKQRQIVIGSGGICIY